MIICGFLCISVLFAVPADMTLSPDEIFIVPNSSGGITDYCLRGREILLFSVAILLVLFWLGERIFPDRPQKSIFVRNRHSLIFPQNDIVGSLNTHGTAPLIFNIYLSAASRKLCVS